ncbi:MAG: hypothetical protein KDJ15_04700 [Alphaproteobacteria bacterium]|nr:hypothetical protein [Alphaproteobacteria bacterium]
MAGIHRDSQTQHTSERSSSSSLGQGASWDSYGLLYTPQEGSLGPATASGSDRETIVDLIGALPEGRTLPTLDSLVTRLLLTTTDPALMSKAAPSQGALPDALLTERIKALVRMGQAEKAAALYGLSPVFPPPDLLAQAGVSALMKSGRTAQGCLEALALESASEGTFWDEKIKYCRTDLQKKQASASREIVPGLSEATPLTVLLSEGKKALRERDMNRLHDIGELIHKINPDETVPESDSVMAMALQMYADVPLSAPWATRWKTLWERRTEENDHTLLVLFLAAATGDYFPEYFNQETLDFDGISLILPSYEREIYAVFDKKLDNTGQLHNIIAAAKEAGTDSLPLTQGEDYVIPWGSWWGDFKKARQKKRLGEVLLLSAVALQNVRSDSVPPAVLSEVLTGFVAVGLTKEARLLAKEVVLGFDKKTKEN